MVGSSRVRAWAQSVVVTLLHRDADFDALAAHTPLQLHLLLENTG